MRWWAVVMMTLVAVVAGGVGGGVGLAEADHDKAVKLIDAGQIKTWIDQGKKFTLVDSRVASEFKEGKLPTAINIPGPQMEAMRDKLPKDKAQPLVFYCNGWPECKKSHEACTKAVQWGHKDVYWFKDGVPGWQAKRYPLQ